MYTVKYQDVGTRKVQTDISMSNKQMAINKAESIRKPGRWVIVFDEETGKQVYNKRD